MRKIIFVFLTVCLLSCVKEKDQFIPTNALYPTNALKSLIPSKSLSVALKNDQSYKLATEYDSYVEIDKGAFAIEVEGSNNYELNIIELKDYVDFILQNVDHENNIGITNTIYSFYVAAEQNGVILDFNEGRKIKVRVPFDNISNELALGIGQFEENNLVWEYFSSNISSHVVYIAWETIKPDGSMKTEYGYEISVDKPGWYSLIAKDGFPTNPSMICLNFNENYNTDNTAAYVLMNDRNYLSKLKMVNDNSSTFCLSDLPGNSNSPFTVISISKFLDGSFHYYKTEVELNQNQLEINASPQVISVGNLRSALEDL